MAYTSPPDPEPSNNCEFKSRDDPSVCQLLDEPEDKEEEAQPVIEPDN